MNNHKKIDWFRWHRRKSWIRMNCAIIMAILLIVLLCMFPIVSDADTLTLNDKYFIGGLLNSSALKQYWSDNNIYRPDSYADSIFYDGDEFNYYNAIYSLFTETPINRFDGTNVNLNYPPHINICSYKNDDSKLLLVFGSISWGYEGDGSISKLTQGYTFSYDIASGSLSELTYSLPTAGNFYNLTSILDKIITASGPISAGGYYNGFSESYPYIDFNYLYINGSNGIGQGGFTVEEPNQTYPDGSGGDITNNMYMRTADWKFNIPQYWTNTSFVNSNPTDRWGSGNVQFYGLINDFQKDHASDYKLKFDFYLQLVGSYDGNTSFAHSYALRNVEYNLTDFLNNNNTYQVNVEYIFTNATDTGGNNIYTTLQDLRGGQISQVFFKTWTLSCSAHLVSGNYTSGNIQETYDFISQISKENSNTITDNNNPYYPPDSDVPDSDGSTSYSSKDGKIILTNYDNDNNNQVVNFNSNDKTVVDSLVDKMVPDNVTGESGLTQRFVTLTNANAWFDVMESSLAIFPTEFWQTIYTIFIASLGILGVAFLLWILVHIL